MIITFDIALERLQKHCPFAEPFVIKKITKEDGLGYFGYHFEWGELEKRKFNLMIATDVDEVMQVEILIHEWAHGLRAIKSPYGHHDDLWGIEYARCYRAVSSDTSDDDDIKASLLPGSMAIFPADKKYGIPEKVVVRPLS